MGTYAEQDYPVMDGDLPVSRLKVLRSNAGWYIGRECFDEFPQPYSRESRDYYASDIEAQRALARDNFEVRSCLENNTLYASGVIPNPNERRKA